MFIGAAYAQGAGGAGGGAGDVFSLLMPFLIVILIMYFLVIRPQQTRQKKHQQMIASLRRGDSVVTAGGMHAKVTRIISDTELQVEIADGVRVKLDRGTIADVRSKGAPVKGD